MYTEPTFQLCWLRESSSGHLDFDAGTAVAADRLELAILGLTPGGAGETTAANSIPAINRLEIHHVCAALESLERCESLPKWFFWRLRAFFGPLNTEERIRMASRNFAVVRSMCDRIRMTNGNRPWSEVHLPYFTRRDWNSRFENLRSMQFECIRGRIRAVGKPDPLSLESIVLRTAALVFQPRPGADVSFAYHSPAVILEQPWAGLLASRWELELPRHLPVRKFELSLPVQGVDAWRRAPRLHHGRHQQVWSRVAISIEWILRYWSLAHQLSSLESLQDVEGCMQSMMFAALRPWAENLRSEPYYDVMNEAHLLQSFRKSTRRLQNFLEMAATWLEDRGHFDLALEYRGANPHLHAARIAERCYRGRAVRNMLRAESGIVNALTMFSQRVRAAESPRALRKVTEELVTGFNEHLPRIFREPGLAELVGPALFLDAVSALGVAVGGNPQLEVRFETVDGAVHRRDNSSLSDLPVAA
jgi:hypothetical protein